MYQIKSNFTRARRSRFAWRAYSSLYKRHRRNTYNYHSRANGYKTWAEVGNPRDVVSHISQSTSTPDLTLNFALETILIVVSDSLARALCVIRILSPPEPQTKTKEYWISAKLRGGCNCRNRKHHSRKIEWWRLRYMYIREVVRGGVWRWQNCPYLSCFCFN